MAWSHRLKLGNAVEHLYALKAATERWTDADPCLVREDCEIETHKHRIFVEVAVAPDDPFIPLRMADCIHNMRQALDHLAYALAARLYGTDPPPNESNTGFPITTIPANFKEAVHAKVAKKAVMPKDLFSSLEAIQPYPGRNQALWLLHELDNMDKHRVPPVVGGVATGDLFSMGNLQCSFFEGPRLGVLDPQTPIVEYIPLDPEAESNMGFEFVAEIKLSEASPVAPGEPILPTLFGIRSFIFDRVLPDIEAFL